ncbi:MAG: glycosyltransferase family 2 protein [Pseudomonadota bacterium]
MSAAVGEAASDDSWTVVIPAFNEEPFLKRTFETVCTQSEPPSRIVLVDNKSTDGTLKVMEELAASVPDIGVTILSDDRPGKVNALETGISAVTTEFIALCDADTVYPADYLKRAARMMKNGATETVASFAFGVYEGTSPLAAKLVRLKGMIVSSLLPRQGHTGGYGQCFRTSALKAAGGYSASVWPYMVADHEVVNRILRRGRIAYAFDHFCLTSARRGDRKRVDWRLHERLLYNVLPYRFQDWFFYEYLRPRFEARGMFNSNLRQRDWDAE